jgi:hypothetical protein
VACIKVALCFDKGFDLGSTIGGKKSSSGGVCACTNNRPCKNGAHSNLNCVEVKTNGLNYSNVVSRALSNNLDKHTAISNSTGRIVSLFCENTEYDHDQVANISARRQTHDAGFDPHGDKLTPQSLMATKHGACTAHSAPHLKVCALRTPGKVCVAPGLRRHCH